MLDTKKNIIKMKSKMVQRDIQIATYPIKLIGLLLLGVKDCTHLLQNLLTLNITYLCVTSLGFNKFDMVLLSVRKFRKNINIFFCV